jgi:hypothetical protein
VQIRSLPASFGAAWLRDGWRLLRRQPLGLPAMVVMYLFMLLVPATIPFVGLAISGVLSPFATLGLMTACREVEGGRAPNPGVYAQPFQESTQRGRLFRLGLINAGLLLVVATGAGLLAGGTREESSSLENVPVRELALQLLLYAPVMVAMWFAPFLAGWHGLEAGKAMFGSVVACWRNLTPLIVYGLLAFAIMVGVSFLAVSVLAPLLHSSQVLSLVLAPVGLALMTLIQASFYPMYRSIFVEEAAVA